MPCTRINGKLFEDAITDKGCTGHTEWQVKVTDNTFLKIR